MNKLPNIQILVKEFNSIFKISDFESVTCLCGFDTNKVISKKDRYGLYSPTVVCRNCGLIFSNPRLNSSALKVFYSSDLYRKIYNYGDYLNEFREKLINSKDNHIFTFLYPLIKKQNSKSILEIGCAAGQNLLEFKKLGFVTKGFDLGVDLVSLGKNEYGLDLENGTIIDIVKSKEKYDVIIINHVIEHFSNIEEDLILLKDVLTPNGLIYVGVPNIDNYSSEQIQNAHNYYFSPRTFCYYMNRFGFKVSNLEPAEGIHMHAILKIDKPILSNLNDEYRVITNIIRMAKIKEVILRVLEYLKVKGFIKSLLVFFRKKYS